MAWIQHDPNGYRIPSSSGTGIEFRIGKPEEAPLVPLQGMGWPELGLGVSCRLNEAAIIVMTDGVAVLYPEHANRENAKQVPSITTYDAGISARANKDGTSTKASRDFIWSVIDTLNIMRPTTPTQDYVRYGEILHELGVECWQGPFAITPILNTTDLRDLGWANLQQTPAHETTAELAR